jgi:sugar phosphate isomerase/epimerase
MPADRGLTLPEIALHGASILHTNIATDIRVAREAGYQGIELWIPKLTRYLDAGFGPEQLTSMLGPLRVTMLDVLMPVESPDRAARQRLAALCTRLAPIAAQLRCPAFQAVALDDFPAGDWPAQRRVLTDSLTELSDITAPYGVRLGIEPVSFSRFHSLRQAVEVVTSVGTDRAGLVLDTWHLWTGGADCDQIAGLDPALIVCVQIGDSGPRQGTSWSDEDRTALPGDGVVPLEELIGAIVSTGYDGTWSVEMLSRRHWEWDPAVLAAELLQRARQLLRHAGCAPRGTGRTDTDKSSTDKSGDSP